jgi:hypothetical protein
MVQVEDDVRQSSRLSEDRPLAVRGRNLFSLLALLADGR